MTREEIINGLKMSMDLTLFDPSTGEVMEPWQLNEVNRTAYEAYKGAIELLEEMPSAQPEPHWIPCSERLPEERGLYLTTTKNKEVYCDYWNEDNFNRTEMVIAWMPLPESYQEGGE